MCNRYSMTRSREEVLHWFGTTDNQGTLFEPTPAIFPGYAEPVVRVAGDGEHEVVELSWG